LTQIKSSARNKKTLRRLSRKSPFASDGVGKIAPIRPAAAAIDRARPETGEAGKQNGREFLPIRDGPYQGC
jgi:hypothetical protein